MNKIASIHVGNLIFGTGSPKICVPITGKTKEDIVEQTKKIKAAAPDIVEWRGDLFDDIMDITIALQMAEVISDILVEIPLLFTFRTKNEGGNRSISIEEYIELNKQLSASGHIHLIDVEVNMDYKQMQGLIDAIHNNGKPVIGSHHRFDCTPSKECMVEVLKKIEAAGADILKLAVMPQEESDVENLMQATKESVSEHVTHPVVTMSMGALGVRTRIEGERFGSSMTFGCVGQTSAPGQMEIADLRVAMKKFDVERF